MEKMHINRLYIMAIVHFIVMLILTYVMVDRVSHIYPNINKVYMAGIMAAPMVIIEGFLMGSMYESQKALYAAMIVSLFIFISLFLFIRTQTGVFDKQFLKSMIPHHSSAILMCRQAKLEDEEIKELCVQIIKTQREEIKQMEDILRRMN